MSSASVPPLSCCRWFVSPSVSVCPVRDGSMFFLFPMACSRSSVLRSNSPFGVVSLVAVGRLVGVYSPCPAGAYSLFRSDRPVPSLPCRRSAPRHLERVHPPRPCRLLPLSSGRSLSGPTRGRSSGPVFLSCCCALLAPACPRLAAWFRRCGLRGVLPTAPPLAGSGAFVRLFVRCSGYPAPRLPDPACLRHGPYVKASLPHHCQVCSAAVTTVSVALLWETTDSCQWSDGPAPNDRHQFPQSLR